MQHVPVPHGCPTISFVNKQIKNRFCLGSIKLNYIFLHSMYKERNYPSCTILQLQWMLKMSFTHVAGLIIVGICFDLMVWITLLMIWKIVIANGCQCFQEKTDVSSVFTMLVSIVYVGYDWLKLYCIFEYNENVCWFDRDETTTAGMTVYFLSIIGFYVAFVSRVYLTIDTTDCSVSATEKRITFVMLLIDCVAMIYFVVQTYLDYANSDSDSDGKHSENRIISGIAIGIIDFSMHGTLLCLILKKFYQRNRNIDEKIKSLPARKDVTDAREEADDTIEKITKYSLFSMLTLIFSQFWNIVAVYINYHLATSKYDDTWYDYLILLAFPCRDIEGLFYCIALYFIHSENAENYNARCKCCHKSLYICCRNCMLGFVKRNYRQST